MPYHHGYGIRCFNLLKPFTIKKRKVWTVRNKLISIGEEEMPPGTSYEALVNRLIDPSLI
ncbi:hypothetical protein [Spirosoma areae]